MIDFQKKRILSFFAHPDDETLSAGGTFAKLAREGIDIHVAIPVTGINARSHWQTRPERKKQLLRLRKDCLTALDLLGIPSKKVYMGDFSDNEMDKHTLLELIHWLENLMVKIKPDVIFTNHRYCSNIDHQYCHEAAVIATRPGINEHVLLISGEVPSSTGHLRPAHWEPNFYVNLSRDDLNAKIEAMKSYKGEIRPFPHPRSPEALEALAKVRGSESGYYFAESFIIQRIFKT